MDPRAVKPPGVELQHCNVVGSITAEGPCLGPEGQRTFPAPPQNVQNHTCALNPNTDALRILACAFGRITYW